MGREGLLGKMRVPNERTDSAKPLVEIFGDRRVLVEHHRGVMAYGRQEVWVRVRYGMVRVWGDGLCLARMTGEQLVICGSIGGVELMKNGGVKNER